MKIFLNTNIWKGFLSVCTLVSAISCFPAEDVTVPLNPQFDLFTVNANDQPDQLISGDQVFADSTIYLQLQSEDADYYAVWPGDTSRNFQQNLLWLVDEEGDSTKIVSRGINITKGGFITFSYESEGTYTLSVVGANYSKGSASGIATRQLTIIRP